MVTGVCKRAIMAGQGIIKTFIELFGSEVYKAGMGGKYVFRESLIFGGAYQTLGRGTCLLGIFLICYVPYGRPSKCRMCSNYKTIGACRI